MQVVVHPKTDTIRRILDNHGDVYELLKEIKSNDGHAVLLKAIKASECCGGRKYHFQGWFKKSEAEWSPK